MPVDLKPTPAAPPPPTGAAVHFPHYRKIAFIAGGGTVLIVLLAIKQFIG